MLFTNEISSEIIFFCFSLQLYSEYIDFDYFCNGMLKSFNESFRIYYYYRVINVSDFVSFTLQLVYTLNQCLL